MGKSVEPRAGMLRPTRVGLQPPATEIRNILVPVRGMLADLLDTITTIN